MEKEKKKLHLKERCTKCGNTIVNEAAGSISLWLFRPAECKCESPSAYPLKIAEAESTESFSSSDAIEELRVQTAFPIENGTIINDHYRIIRPLGAGGMGNVYQVEDQKTKLVFALKIISSSLAQKRPLAKRFEQEARAAGRLTHPNIAAVYDVGEAEDNSPFLIMDYVEGPSLEQKLKKEGYLEVPHAVNISIQVAEALAYAHKQGVVHRDIKPSNILLQGDEHDRVKLVDFGIAKVNEQKGVDATKLTQTGELFGSPLYMSPEQCRGDDVDARSDIYSLGCVMYESLTGRPPFQGENPVRVILKHLSEEAKPLPKVVGASAGLKQIVARCLAKNVKERYASADELLVDLHKIRDGKRLVFFHRRNNKKFVRYAAVLAALGTLFLGAQWFQSYATMNSNNDVSNEKRLDSQSVSDIQATGWDLLDIRGQNYLNSGEYAKARKEFDEASHFPDASEKQKLLSLKKLAILHHITGDRKSEYELDKQIEKITNAETSKSKRFSEFQIHTLAKSLQAVSSEKNAADTLAQELLLVSKQLLQDDRGDEAYKLVSASIAKLEKTLGAKSSIVLELKGIEAESLFRKGKFDESIAKTEILLEKLGKGTNDNHELLNSNLLRLAAINNIKGNGAQAEPFAKMVMENLAAMKPSETKSQYQLAAMHAFSKSLYMQGRYDEAIAETKKTIVEAEATKNFEILDKAMTDLTNLYAARNEFKNAESALLDSLNSADPKTSLVKASYCAILGNLYYRQDRTMAVTGKAQKYLAEALAIRQHLLAPESLEVRASLKDMAFFNFDQRQFADAATTKNTEALARQLSAVLEREDQKSILLTKVYARLASLLAEKGEQKEAKQFVAKTMSRLSDDPETSNIIDESFYAAVNQLIGSKGMNDLAEFFEKRTERLKLEHGENSILVAIALDDVAHIYAREGRLDKAGPVIEQAVKIIREENPASLSAQNRWLGANVLDNYSYYLSKTGHGNWMEVHKEAEAYRYKTTD